MAWFVARTARQRQMATGQQFPVFWTSVALIVGLPVLAYVLSGFPLSFDLPKQSTFNLTGGFQVKPEFLSLYLALSCYTAAFIAEIVRAGIRGVSKGQTEAAAALGLRSGSILRLVVVPQAMQEHDMSWVRTEMALAQPAPASVSGPGAWVRRNLIGSVGDTILTILGIVIVAWVLPQIINWAFINAVWTGPDRTVCATVAQGGIQPDGWSGACWAFVNAKFGQFMATENAVSAEEIKVNAAKMHISTTDVAIDIIAMRLDQSRRPTA